MTYAKAEAYIKSDPDMLNTVQLIRRLAHAADYAEPEIDVIAEMVVASLALAWVRGYRHQHIKEETELPRYDS